VNSYDLAVIIPTTNKIDGVRTQFVMRELYELSNL
jgi:hypothetical protein